MISEKYNLSNIIDSLNEFYSNDGFEIEFEPNSGNFEISCTDDVRLLFLYQLMKNFDDSCVTVYVSVNENTNRSIIKGFIS